MYIFSRYFSQVLMWFWNLIFLRLGGFSFYFTEFINVLWFLHWYSWMGSFPFFVLFLLFCTTFLLSIMLILWKELEHFHYYYVVFSSMKLSGSGDLGRVVQRVHNLINFFYATAVLLGIFKFSIFFRVSSDLFHMSFQIHFWIDVSKTKQQHTHTYK